MAKLFMLLLLCMMLASPSSGTVPKCEACTTTFIETPRIRKTLADTVKSLFENSLLYLYTSYAFAGQNMERKGLSKYFKKMSDDTWDEGLEGIKKILERGGRIDRIVINKTPLPTDMKEQNAMTTVKESVKKIIIHYNNLHSESNKENIHDADFGMFFSKKMHEATEKYRQLVAHTIELGRITGEGAGIALDTFDANL